MKNDYSHFDLSSSQIAKLIEEAANKVCDEVEFDIHDAVMRRKAGPDLIDSTDYSQEMYLTAMISLNNADMKKRLCVDGNRMKTDYRNSESLVDMQMFDKLQLYQVYQTAKSIYSVKQSLLDVQTS